MNRVLVTGATGNVGGKVLSQLVAQGVDVRALVRNPKTAHLPEEVEIVAGDLTEPETLDRCLDGIDSVFLVWVLPPITIAPVIEKIAQRAKRIVFLSAPLKTDHPFFQQPNMARKVAEQVEQSIEGSGLEWTFLRPGMLASNAVRWWAPQIRAGDVVRWPYLSVPTSPIDERDIATVAVRVLCEDGHAGAEYVLTGPESLNQAEQIATIGEVLGRSLRIEEISPASARTEMAGVIPGMLLDAWAAAEGQPAFLSSTFTELTGVQARTFRTWAEDHAAEFRYS